MEVTFIFNISEFILICVRVLNRSYKTKKVKNNIFIKYSINVDNFL